MTTKQLVTSFSILPLLLLAIGCRSEAPNESASEEPAATEAPSATATETPDADVAYEPAYPADVSAEGLSEEDAAQQQATHSHGGEEHSHAEGEDHPHGEGEGAHTHEDEDHDDHQD
ncbi:MAG TPA: hypothetical protein VMT16_09190 [Thermoanaerobaculia bacterium]|nr:hypothetical protein [Thermoanaerobaculia bacterium]